MIKKTTLSCRAFTLIELLIVLVVITCFVGVLFPVGNLVQARARRLEVKTDALRFQSAFLSYYQQYEDFPTVCLKDRWFDLSSCFSSFIKTLVPFCSFTAEELNSEKTYPVFFFLCDQCNALDAKKQCNKPSKEIYGTKVLFYLP